VPQRAKYVNVGEFRGSPDDCGDDKRPDDNASGSGADEVHAFSQPMEERSRAEYAVDLRRQVGSGPEPAPAAEGAGDTADETDASADSLRNFDFKRAGLREVDAGEAAAYIEAHRAERPWLDVVRSCPADVQRIFVALDQGGGHAHIRHDGWGSEEMMQRRLQCLEDPTQLDESKRSAHIDGLKSGDKPHRCGSSVTRITDPVTFAEAISRAAAHPEVGAALQQEFKEKWVPPPMVVPAAEILGADGHRFCSGWELEPVDGDMAAARQQRDAWASALVGHESPDGAAPKIRPIETFEGGTMLFLFGPNEAKDGYEIVTMYVNPPDGPQHGGMPT
jgi:hypothetical protein